MKLRTARRIARLLPLAVAVLVGARAEWFAQPPTRPGPPTEQDGSVAAGAAAQLPNPAPVLPGAPSPVRPDPEPATSSPPVAPVAADPAALPMESPPTHLPAESLPVESLPVEPAAPAPVGEPPGVPAAAAEVLVDPQDAPPDDSSAAQDAGGQDGPGSSGTQWDRAEVRALSPQLSKRAVRLADALAAAAPLPVPASRLAVELGVDREAIGAYAAALNRTAAATRPYLPAPVQQHGTNAKPRYALEAAFAAHWPPEQD